MGEKGARQSAAGAATVERLMDEFAPLGDVTARKMFGGYGVFAEGVMFAIVDSAGAAFLRADEATASKYADAGSDKHGRMPYWEIPAEVRENSSLLVEWAGEAHAAAAAAKKK